MKNILLLIMVLVSGSVFSQTAKPSVSAGNNITITLPTSTANLSGKACDADGSIANFKWSGTKGTVTSPNSASTTVTGLSAAGNYIFVLKATDNSGLSDSATVTVIVNPAQPPTNNTPPRSYAGADVTIQLPTNSVTLAGKGTDNDGTVVSFLWSKEVGSGGSFSNPNTATTTFSGLSAGDYRLKLTVTDNNGATGSDTVHIKVNPGNPPPGGDTLPPPSGDYSLIYQNGYDRQADLDPFGHDQIGNGSLSTTIFKTGPGSFKSVPANVSSGIRSEVQYDEAQTPLEGIVEYDVYYDNFFSNSGHSFQWHPSTSGGSGTGLYHKDGKMQFVTVKSGTSGTNVGSPWTVSTKVWHHMKLTYKFGSSGYIQVEMDGVVVLPKTNVQMGDGSRPYAKCGQNLWVNQASVIYYDNYKTYKKN